MNTIELTKNFHILIDSIDNDNLLVSFYDLIKKRSSTKEGQLWSRLTSQEQEELLDVLKESKNPGNLISHEEMVIKHKKWLKKFNGRSKQIKNSIKFLNINWSTGMREL